MTSAARRARIAYRRVEVAHRFRVQVLERAAEGKDRTKGFALVHVRRQRRNAVPGEFIFDVLERPGRMASLVRLKRMAYGIFLPKARSCC